VPSRALCLLFALTCAWSCAPTPAPSDPPRPPAPPAVSAEQDALIGLQGDAAIRQAFGLLGDAALQRDVQQVGARLAAESSDPSRPWHFAVADIAAPNAFALPGGYVYVTRGLLPYLSSHSDLAAVLGHEVAHVVRGDVNRDDLAGLDKLPADLGVLGTVASLFGPRVGPAVTRALFSSHTPDVERQADAAAAEILARAGFDPASLNVVLDTLDRLDLETDQRGVPTWGTTHGRDLRLAPAPSLTISPPAADDFDERLRNLLFGDDPREGLLRASEFVKPDLRVALTIPMNWDVSSDRTRVIAAAPGGDAFLLLKAEAAARWRQVADVAATLLTRAGFGAPSGVTTTINGLATYIGLAAGRVQGMGDVQVRVACMRSGRRVFLLAGVAGTSRFREVDGQLVAAIDSFRAMPPAEADRIRPHRIELEAAREGDTWATIARRHGGVVMASLLATLNHAAADRPPPPGVLLKVVSSSEK